MLGFEDLEGEEYYNFERGSKRYDEAYSLNIISKIALIYPSDFIYTYAYGVDNTCHNNGYYCNNGNRDSGWLHATYTWQWCLNPSSINSKDVFVMYSDNYLRFNHPFNGVFNKFSVVPSLYLNSNTKIKSGDGSKENPYELTL